MTRIDVSARREGEHYIVECSECGPLGVTPELEAVAWVKAHLTGYHRIEKVEQGEQDAQD